MKYPHVFVAGTFDGLHKGHRFFLSKAFSLGQKVTIGLTSDIFQKKNKAKYKMRKKILEQWLKRNNWKADIISIDDPYEPAASYKESVVLLVTPDNKHRGQEINTMRIKRGLPAFTLIEVPLVKAEDQKPISSMRVRYGEIDTEGRLILPDNLRPQLQKPLGLVLSGTQIKNAIKKQKGKIIITVGDVATKTLLEVGVVPSLIIIDNKVERKPYKGLSPWKNTTLLCSAEVASGPGYIAKEAIALIRKWSRQPQKSFVIEVEGEEDLLALPVLTEAPGGAIVYYGQPQKGLVEAVVTPKKKKKVVELLKRFI